MMYHYHYLNPSVVITNDVRVVHARERRHLAQDLGHVLPRFDTDAFHSVVESVQFVAHAPHLAESTFIDRYRYRYR